MRSASRSFGFRDTRSRSCGPHTGRKSHQVQARSEAERDAHNYVTIITWASIDVTTVEQEIREKQEEYERLLLVSDVLRELKQRESKLAERLEGVQHELFGAEGEQKSLDTEHGRLLASQDQVGAHPESMDNNPAVVLTEQQSARLQAAWDATGWPPAASFPRT